MFVWFKEWKGVVMFGVGIVSSFFGVMIWLAMGGATPYLTAQSALSDQEVVTALVDLPAAQERTAATLDGMAATLAALQLTLIETQIEYRRFQFYENRIVAWKPEESQYLTDLAGECSLSEGTCLAYFRGARTVAGESCEFLGTQPSLISLPAGTSLPIRPTPDFEPVELTQRPRTIAFPFYLPAGQHATTAIVVLTNSYRDCMFAEEGEIAYRDAPAIRVRIVP